METSKMTCRGCIWRRRWLFSTANIAAFEQTEDIIAAAVDKEDHLLGGTRIHTQHSPSTNSSFTRYSQEKVRSGGVADIHT
ncbi:hypothetical protein HID58_014809 [Brassica napus]|uniref:Uncharacterized protein n=1 Tax=Brassica napus TaxID=3708 RepID=A0ABQ8DI64_BRANA|nr:hypothetical protein HID58_014809 [Brassica napus]